MQTPGPSHTKSISGTTTGLLDPTQSSRILSAPGSRLSFATFHPRTASAVTRKLSTRDELCSQKRVVIETLVGGESFWRWVPRAKGVENTNDEGAWPRIINICGCVIFDSFASQKVTEMQLVNLFIARRSSGTYTSSTPATFAPFDHSLSSLQSRVPSRTHTTQIPKMYPPRHLVTNDASKKFKGTILLRPKRGARVPLSPMCGTRVTARTMTLTKRWLKR